MYKLSLQRVTAERQQEKNVLSDPCGQPRHMAAARWRRPAAGVVAGASAPGMPAASHASPISASVRPPPPTMRYESRRWAFFERVYGFETSWPSSRSCGSPSFPQESGGSPRIVFAVSPNSASCERVFALLKNLFGDDATSALADYLQAGLMLNYNKRQVG